ASLRARRMAAIGGMKERSHGNTIGGVGATKSKRARDSVPLNCQDKHLLRIVAGRIHPVPVRVWSLRRNYGQRILKREVQNRFRRQVDLLSLRGRLDAATDAASCC